MDILQRIAHWAKTAPDRPAYIHREEGLTYRELEEGSNAVAAALLARFGRSRQPILIYGHMQPAMPLAFLACAKSGHAYIPVDDSAPAGRLLAILDNAQPAAIVAISEWPADLGTGGVPLIHGLASLLQANEQLATEARIGSDDDAYIIYTSGSTGAPKGVRIALRNLDSFVSWIEPLFAGTNPPVSLNQAPYSFDLSVMDLYPTFVQGGTVWALDRSMVGKPAELFAALQVSPISVWTSTPSFAEFCLRHPAFEEGMLPRLRTFLFCGEALSPGIAGELLRRFPQAEIYNTYGPTEATVAVTSVKVDHDLLTRYPVLPVGRIKPDCRIRIVDEQGQTLTEGERGEVVIVGPSVGPGYYRNPELSERSFAVVHDAELGDARAYRTGDAGFVQDGLLFYGGRLDFQVKLHGYRIEPEEIEHQLRKLGGVRAAVVLPRFEGGACQYLTAFVVTETRPAEPLSWAIAVKKQLSAGLPDYMVPRRIVWKEELPVTANGKVDRKRLAEEV